MQMVTFTKETSLRTSRRTQIAASERQMEPNITEESGTTYTTVEAGSKRRTESTTKANSMMDTRMDMESSRLQSSSTKESF